MADKTLATYSPESVSVTIQNGNFQHIISGYADGTFLGVERVVPHATLYTGADASNARVVRAVRNYDITLTLHQASESNDVLSQLLELDAQSRNGDDLFSIIIKDNSGRTMYSSASAFIGTDPAASFGTDITETPWIIHCVNTTSHVGGNGKLLSDTFDTLNDLGYDVDERWNANATN